MLGFKSVQVDLIKILLEKHSYVRQVSRALHGVATTKLAVIFEWEQPTQNRAKLFVEALRTNNQRVIGGIAMAHFMHLARKRGVPQAILAEFARVRRTNRQLSGDVIRQTRVLVDVLADMAAPFLTSRGNTAFDGELMETIVL